MDDTRPISDVSRLLAGRYRLLGSIGHGGMAEVQRAYDEQLDREVAVKILHARYADDRSFLLRFRREAQSAAGLNHPNIVSVYDAGDADGRPFIVMELVRGRSLRDLTRSERITAGRAIEIVGDAALALNYAHEHGLVHRDIKPGNILISNDGEVKVTDFGIARAVNAETITETAAVFGTAAYVAPEQAQGEAVDRRTDVYALGCVLYELLAGRQPFHADSPVALAYQHVSATPTPPSHLSDESSAELDAITLKAMAKDPADRYQTAREFNADLERARSGVPVTAPMAGAYGATQMVDRGDRTMVSSGAGYAPPEDAYYDDRYDARYDDRYYAEDEPPGRTGWWVLGIVILLAALVGGWFLLSGGGEADTVALPDVTGELFPAAQARLEALDLTVRREAVDDADAVENEVVRQDPAGGEDVEVERGSEVTLFVNSGTPSVQVPDVGGLPLADARTRLEEAGLTIGDREREASDDVDEGSVIRTDPEADAEVEEGSPVDLVVSSGSENATIPNVVDRLESDAESLLETACDPEPCFEVATVETNSDTVDVGRVISQTPEAATTAPKGSRVQLVVSLGPDEPEPEPEPEPTPEPEPPVTSLVPDLAGTPLTEAGGRLSDAGLSLGETFLEPSSDVPVDVIIRTEPAGGQTLTEGTPVNVIVSSGPPEPTSGDGTDGDDG